MSSLNDSNEELFHDFPEVPSTSINLNILSLTRWLMLLFTTVKSCFNKKALRWVDSFKGGANIYNTQR